MTMKNDDLAKETKGLMSEIKKILAIPSALLIAMWIIEIIDVFVLQQRLNIYGIRPRSIQGLWGILFAPFLHANFGHLAANSGPFFVLAWLVISHGIRKFFLVSIIVSVLGGLGVWLIAPANSVHIGASGLVFGYFGFLLLWGFFEKSLATVATSLIVGFLYGGLIFGVLPSTPGVSWQSHLFGFAAGIFSARIIGRKSTGKS